MQLQKPQSYDDFWTRCEAKQAVAEVFKEDPKHALEAWEATGMALEFAFKATIWKRERFNRWPDGGEPYTHDLQRLFRILGVDHTALPPRLRSALKVAFQWDVEHRYARNRLPRATAREFFKAAFEDEGIVEWLRSL